MAKIQMDGWQCLRCGHTWVPRAITVRPTICPNCKSAYWGRERAPDAKESRIWTTDTERQNAPDGWYIQYLQTDSTGEILIGPYASAAEAEAGAVDYERIESATGSPAKRQGVVERRRA